MINMNDSNVIFLINDEVRAVKVQYDEGNINKITTKKTFMTDLKVGDFVLVETGTRWNATVAKVVDINCAADFANGENISWVFSKVNMAELEALKELEKRALQIIKEAEKKKVQKELRETVRGLLGPDFKSLEYKTPTMD